MSQSPDLSTSLNQAVHVTKKLHYVFFGIVLIIIVGLAVLAAGSSLNMPNDTAFEQSINSKRTVENFDTDPTIPRVNKLEFSDQNTNVSLPTDQRINPFVE
jgi:hypothetical protein